MRYSIALFAHSYNIEYPTKNWVLENIIDTTNFLNYTVSRIRKFSNIKNIYILIDEEQDETAFLKAAGKYAKVVILSYKQLYLSARERRTAFNTKLYRGDPKIDRFHAGADILHHWSYQITELFDEEILVSCSAYRCFFDEFHIEKALRLFTPNLPFRIEFTDPLLRPIFIESKNTLKQDALSGDTLLRNCFKDPSEIRYLDSKANETNINSSMMIEAGLESLSGYQFLHSFLKHHQNESSTFFSSLRKYYLEKPDRLKQPYPTLHIFIQDSSNFKYYKFDELFSELIKYGKVSIIVESRNSSWNNPELIKLLQNYPNYYHLRCPVEVLNDTQLTSSITDTFQAIEFNTFSLGKNIREIISNPLTQSLFKFSQRLANNHNFQIGLNVPVPSPDAEHLEIITFWETKTAEIQQITSRIAKSRQQHFHFVRYTEELNPSEITHNQTVMIINEACEVIPYQKPHSAIEFFQILTNELSIEQFNQTRAFFCS